MECLTPFIVFAVAGLLLYIFRDENMEDGP